MTYFCVAKLRGSKGNQVQIVNAAAWRNFINANFTVTKSEAAALLETMRREFPKYVYELVEVED